MIQLVALMGYINALIIVLINALINVLIALMGSG